MEASGGIPGYTLEEVIGRGAMGTVWRARQISSDGRLVALKRVRDSDGHLVERLRREGGVLARLDHPHIIRLFELLPDGDGIAIAMQFAPGGSLADLLAQRGRLEPAEGVPMLATMAAALGSAHRQGVLHRDVKPSNILFTSDGEPLLSDFGIARASGDQPLTDPSLSALGTAEYLDPEVAGGAQPDARSDVYALGIVCYQTLSGRRPFEAANPLAVLRLADRGGAARLDEVVGDITPALADTVARAMDRRPDHRFADATQLAAALRRAQDPAAGAALLVRRHAAPAAAAAAAQVDPGETRSPETRAFGPRPLQPARDEAPPPSRRRLWIALSGIGLLLAAGATAAVLLTRPPAESPEPPPEAALPYCRSAPPAAGPGETVLEGDLTGQGCLSWVRRQGTLLEAALEPDSDPMRYEVGQSEDALVLGDWNCDGRDTPGLYRPGTGELFLFDDWADDEPLRSRFALGTGVPGGTPRIVTEDGCDEVVIDQA